MARKSGGSRSRGARPSSPAQFKALARSFSREEFAPLYLLWGEESYFIDELERRAVRHAVEADLRDFNYALLDGEGMESSRAISICSQPPLIAPRRLIIIRRFDKMRDRRRWVHYVKRPNEHAVVLLSCKGKLDFRQEPYKALRAAGYETQFAPLARRQVAPFIKAQVQEAGGTIDAKAVSYLEDYVGTDARTIVGEVAKLRAFAGDRTDLTADDVMQAIGQSRTINFWELRDALVEGRTAEAENIASLCLQRSTNRTGDALGLIAMLRNYYLNVWSVWDMTRRGRRYPEIASAIRGQQWMVKRYMETARRYNGPRLQHVFATLTAADCELKGARARDARLVLTLMMRKMSYLAKK